MDRHRLPLLHPQGRQDLPRPSGVGGRVFQLVGYATTGGALSREDTARYDPDIPADERRGYYSRALVEGLRGGAVDPDVP